MTLTNAEIKNIKKLKDKKYRKTENLFLVEGVKLCEEVKNSKYIIEKTLSSNEKFKDYPNFVLVDYEILKTVATTETPQEIVCVCRKIENEAPSPRGNSLILDELQDPGNIGTLIRSAVAFNFNDVYFINCADVFSEKIIRASMGAIFKINIHIVSRDFIINNKRDICDCMLGTDLHSKNVSCNSSKKLAVVIGNEGNGVSKDILNACDKIVTLEMTDRIESLNAGVAGSILMYEIFKNKF